MYAEYTWTGTSDGSESKMYRGGISLSSLTLPYCMPAIRYYFVRLYCKPFNILIGKKYYCLT